jgi:hypothetical protein
MPSMIRLSREEELVAAAAGLARESRFSSNPKFVGDKGNLHNAVMIHAEAVGAEIAVAKYFQFTEFHPTVNTFKNEADITMPNGLGIEVKQTKYHGGNLIIHEDDRDTDIAVLVTGTSPTYTIRGWIPVSVCKKPKYQSSDGSYWITQTNLQPIEYLLRSIHGQNQI